MNDILLSFSNFRIVSKIQTRENREFGNDAKNYVGSSYRYA